MTKNQRAFGFNPEQRSRVVELARKPGRPSSLFVTYKGKKMDLRSLADVVPIGYEALRVRYRNGMRGAALVGECRRGRPPKKGNWSAYV